MATITITNRFASATTVTGWAATATGHLVVAAGNCNGDARFSGSRP